MSAGNLRCNLGNFVLQIRHSLHSQQPRQSQQFWAADWAIMLITSGNLVIFFSLSLQSPILGRQYRQSQQSLQSRHFRPAILSFFQSQHAIIYSCPAISALSAISGENFGDLGNLANICILVNLSNLCSLRNVGRHSPSQSWQIRSAKSALSSLPATSAISAILGRSLCSNVIPVWQPHQFFLSQLAITHSRPAILAIPAISGDSLGDLTRLEISAISALLQSLQSLQCRPAISVAISTILARTFGNLGLKIRHSQQPRQSRHFWAAVSSPGNPVRQPRQFFQPQHAIIHSCPAISALPAILGENPGDLGNLAKICILGNLSNLCSPRKVGRHSPSQSWQFRSAYLALSSLPATSAVSAILGGRLCDHVNTVWQPRHFFLSQHAITHSRPAKSVIPANLGDTLSDLGNLGNICILGNPSNLCSLCNVGRQSLLQSQQS